MTAEAGYNERKGNCGSGTAKLNKLNGINEEEIELEAAEQLWKREIKSLEEKLRNFRQGFIQFYGYTPEFFSDLLYVKKLKIKPTQL